MSQTHIQALVRALGFDPEGTHRQIGVDDDLPIEYPLVVYRMPGYCLTAVTPDLEEALDLLWEQPEERGPVELLQPLLEHVDLQADGAQLLHVTQQTLRPCPAPEGGVCRMLSQADDEALEQFLDALTIPERVAGALDWTEGPCMGLFQDGRLWSAASLRDTAYKAIYAKEGYIRQHMKEPTVQEIADEIGIAKEDVVYALDAIQMPVSLHEPVYSDGGDTLYVMDQVSDKKNKEENWVEELSLEAAMERLNERERYIITLRFFEGKTQMEVAEQIHISQAQVSRLEKNALKIMRKYLLGE